MKRRDFISWVGLGVLTSSLPVAIAACQSSDNNASSPTPSPPSQEIDSTPREDGFAAIGTVTELDENGFISDKSFLGEQIILIRDPNNADAVIAVNSFCTHQGCTVSWDESATQFACPCHGSKFNSDGTVAAGPAQKELGTFESKIEDTLVLVKIA